MRRWWKASLTGLLALSLAYPVFPPAVRADDVPPLPPLAQVGSTLDFEDGELVGTVSGAPAASGPGSITVAEFDGNKVLRVHPPEPGSSGQTTSFWWNLPLDSGTYDLTDKDLVELEFDWWVEITRPTANSLDVRLMDGGNRVLTVRTAGTGTSLTSPAAVTYYTGNATGDNTPETGSPVTAVNPVIRLTPLHVRLNLDLLLQTAQISLTDGGTILYETPAPVPIPSGQITALEVGAARASGQNWARPNGWDADTHEADYGMRFDNLVIRAAASGRPKPDILPTNITITPASGATLEVGPGSLPGRQTATFTATVEPVNATNKNIVWSITDPDVAEIEVHGDQSVTVTAKNEGSAFLKAVSEAVYTVESQVPIVVNLIPDYTEPRPDFSDLLSDGYGEEFGSTFSIQDSPPLWIFDGGTYHSLAREDAPNQNFYFRFDASGSGNRGGKGDLPRPVVGSKVYVHFDWKVPAVTTATNTFNISLQDEDRVLVSLRTGTRGGNRTIGAFAGPLPGPTGAVPDFWNSGRYHEFSYNTVEIWYTVGIELDFEAMQATVSLRPRDNAGAAPSVVTFPFEGTRITSVVLTGERFSGNNINIVDNGIDNLFFFSKPLSPTTIVEVLPYPFLRPKPPLADENFKQSWFKTVTIGEVESEADLGLPDTVQVRLADDSVAEVGVEWELVEVPWTMAKEGLPLQYDPNRQGVFTYEGTLIEKPGVAHNPMKVQARLYIENRPPKLTDAPLSMEWLDRGVVAVPAGDASGILVQWRLLATEYGRPQRFHVYRNGTRITTAPVSTLNYIDPDGQPGDRYAVERVGGTRSAETAAVNVNFLEIPLQRPKDRPNPALAYGATSNADPITYSANDMSVADVDADGRYELLVKWYPSQAQDPGLANRHTGETIFDLYTLDGKLLWRINLGINIVSSAHHSPFHFYDLDQDGKAEFAVKTADGTRVYLPKADGTIDDLTDEPAWVIGNPDAVWVGGLRNPAQGNQVNPGALGRVSTGPEYFTVFDGRTGKPLKTVDYFAPYSINPDWGDNNNNRSDRFNGGVAYMPRGGVPGADPYPTIIEVRGHYGPHFVAAYQWLHGDIRKIWEFRLAEWSGAGSNQGNHNLKMADLDGDGYTEAVLGAIALDHDGTLMWSSTGTRGTVVAGHGDALHVAPMLPDSDDLFVFQPHEKGPPDNVTLVRGRSGEPVWTYAANLGDVGRGVAGNVTPLPGYEVWAIATPMYNVKTGEIMTTETGDIGVSNKAPVNFVLYWDDDLLHEFFDGPDNLTVTDPPSITKFVYNPATKTGSLETVQVLTGTYTNNGTKANPGLIADILGDWRDEVLVRTADDEKLRIYITDIPTEHVIYTLMHDPQYRMAVSSQNAMYNQPAHPGFYLGEDIRDKVANLQLPVPNIRLTFDREPRPPSSPPGQPGPSTPPAGQVQDDPSQVVLDPEDLPESGDGRRVVTLPENAASVVLPPGLATVLADETLVIRIDDTIELALDAQTIAAMGADGDTASEVRIEWRREEAEEVRPVVDQAAGELPVNVTVRTVSAAYAIGWTSSEDPDQQTDGPAEWPEPIRVTVRVSEDADPDLVGLYRIEEDGSLVYVGGTVRDGTLVAEVTQPGKYVVLEYERHYDDVDESHWAYQAIRAMSAKHILQGVSAESFDPAGTLTRAQLVTLVVRAAGLKPQGSASGAFEDVPDDAWFADAVGAAYAAGLVQGKTATSFAPDDPVSREEAAVILVRTLILVTGWTPPAEGDGFLDEEQINDWALEAVKQAQAAGLLRGRGNGTFDPGAFMTRAEGAQLIKNLLDILSSMG